MRTSTNQDDNFLASVISSTLLEDSIDWIQDNMTPEDVFSELQLGIWAKENNFKFKE